MVAGDGGRWYCWQCIICNKEFRTHDIGELHSLVQHGNTDKSTIVSIFRQNAKHLVPHPGRLTRSLKKKVLLSPLKQCPLSRAPVKKHIVKENVNPIASSDNNNTANESEAVVIVENKTVQLDQSPKRMDCKQTSKSKEYDQSQSSKENSQSLEEISASLEEDIISLINTPNETCNPDNMDSNSPTETCNPDIINNYIPNEDSNCDNNMNSNTSTEVYNRDTPNNDTPNEVCNPHISNDTPHEDSHPNNIVNSNTTKNGDLISGNENNDGVTETPHKWVPLVLRKRRGIVTRIHKDSSSQIVPKLIIPLTKLELRKPVSKCTGDLETLTYMAPPEIDNHLTVNEDSQQNSPNKKEDSIEDRMDSTQNMENSFNDDLPLEMEMKDEIEIKMDPDPFVDSTSRDYMTVTHQRHTLENKDTQNNNFYENREDSSSKKRESFDDVLSEKDIDEAEIKMDPDLFHQSNRNEEDDCFEKLKDSTTKLDESSDELKEINDSSENIKDSILNIMKSFDNDHVPSVMEIKEEIEIKMHDIFADSMTHSDSRVSRTYKRKHLSDSSISLKVTNETLNKKIKLDPEDMLNYVTDEGNTLILDQPQSDNELTDDEEEIEEKSITRYSASHKNLKHLASGPTKILFPDYNLNTFQYTKMKDFERENEDVKRNLNSPQNIGNFSKNVICPLPEPMKSSVDVDFLSNINVNEECEELIEIKKEPYDFEDMPTVDANINKINTETNRPCSPPHDETVIVPPLPNINITRKEKDEISSNISTGYKPAVDANINKINTGTNRPCSPPHGEIVTVPSRPNINTTREEKDEISSNISTGYRSRPTVDANIKKINTETDRPCSPPQDEILIIPSLPNINTTREEKYEINSNISLGYEPSDDTNISEINTEMNRPCSAPHDKIILVPSPQNINTTREEKDEINSNISTGYEPTVDANINKIKTETDRPCSPPHDEILLVPSLLSKTREEKDEMSSNISTGYNTDPSVKDIATYSGANNLNKSKTINIQFIGHLNKRKYSKFPSIDCRRKPVRKSYGKKTTLKRKQPSVLSRFSKERPIPEVNYDYSRLSSTSSDNLDTRYMKERGGSACDNTSTTDLSPRLKCSRSTTANIDVSTTLFGYLGFQSILDENEKELQVVRRVIKSMY